ncbi:MAG: hypothetical protein BGO31_07475 [Bacteroidetes bacterium 43-16]|nr:MAG: hypothetical protein BGO31_07475 [Bacteroidetes bacterium 43-16]
MEKLSTHNRLWAIVAIAGLLGLSSCKNEPVMAPTTEKQVLQSKGTLSESGSIISQKHDWLSFKDIRAFESTVTTLESFKEPEELEQWLSQFKGFKTWKSGEPEEVGGNSDQEVRIDIPDALLTTLLSASGRIQIADTIYQLGHDHKAPLLFAVPQNKEADLLKGREPGFITGTIAHQIGLHLMPFFPKWEDNERVVTPYPVSEICNYPNQVLFPWWGQKGDYIYQDNNGNELTKDNGRNVRIDYHRWRVGFLFYSSAGVRVKIYKDTRLGGWMSTVKMNHVFLEACSKGIILVPGLIPVPYNAQISASSSNTNSLERTVKWVAAPLHVEVLPHHFNFNFTVNYKGQLISRFIRE